MALLPPIILVWKPKSLTDEQMYNHEAIHHRQMLELLIIPFFCWYGYEYMVSRLKGLNHYNAYRSISFEKEAYAQEHNLNYLASRKWWSFVRYIR